MEKLTNYAAVITTVPCNNQLLNTANAFIMYSTQFDSIHLLSLISINDDDDANTKKCHKYEYDIQCDWSIVESWSM